MTPDLLTNQWFITAVAAAITGFFTWAGTRATKAPDVQSSLNAAVAGITAHYATALESSTAQITAMRQEISSLQHTVEAQSVVIQDLQDHIDDLIKAMASAGVAPPARKKTKGAVS